MDLPFLSLEWNCFMFLFVSGAILAVEPAQVTLPITTSLAYLCSALIWKHWFGEVRLPFGGFCPQEETFRMFISGAVMPTLNPIIWTKQL